MKTNSSRLLALLVLCSSVNMVQGGDKTLPSAPFEIQHLITDNNEGLAVGDVNRDGAPDLVAGRHWYAGPKFKARPLREIAPFGDDYLEDNGDHLYDVNGDGWLDVVSGSFLPTQVFWFENPGAEGLKQDRMWPAHLLADTGYSQNEISYLRDMDGDGAPEFVVNCWDAKGDLAVWRFVRDSQGIPALEKQLLGRGAHGHGMGFGDVNGDGREDILVGEGWSERPDGNPWTGAWRFHRDWQIPHASCPMLVTDLNGDGRNDLIVGNGHGYGLYWHEQLEPDGATTRWRRHVIDESFSQAHALLWLDLDRDGQPELVTGKRYYAHSGKDPGANDPPCLYFYTWDRAGLAFKRHTIALGNVGIGLQIGTADFDGDGRVDLAVPGKNGTYVLLNRLDQGAAASIP